MQKIGILGGTFDPPHIGHLILAEYTMEALGLDQVLFVPVADHPHKARTRQMIDHRLRMIELAIASNERFVLSRVDMDRPGPHYSADTVAILQRDFPDAELYFVMGGDNLRSLPTWTRAEDLYRLCRLAVMRRADEAISPDMHGDLLPGLAERVTIVDVPLLSVWVSSTHVVERIRRGQSVRYLVPDAVLSYIQEHRIYQDVCDEQD
ncbi:MAG: nicotinate-nucleotide adenylyltransferase [Anaerolineae bacterium]|nr:nicotinate-nucleotide adenylyltransferase [Anaerolineae bacterium]MDW8171344.1 nicotinate-nucleotide adenylyltransferase [Anaerolineae bacterium]